MGNARQSAYFYRNAFGFDVVAYAGPRDRRAARGGLRAAAGARSPSSSPRRCGADHPDDAAAGHATATACRTIALEVDDVAAAYRDRRRPRGAAGVAAADASRTSTASTSSPTIRAYGDTTHTLRQPRSRTTASSRPGSEPLDPDRYSPGTFHPVGLKAIDHIVANVEEGKMDDWVDFYEQGAGLLAAGPASTTRTSAPSTRP